MAYGIIKVDTITYTDGGSDQSISVSGLVQSISGDITSTGTIQAQNIIGLTTVSGATVSGDTGQFTNLTAVSGVFTAQISGATVTGNVGSFTTITGGTVTLTSGVFASGTAAAPSVSIGTTDNGLYSPGADQVAVATNGTGRLFVNASGNVGVGTPSPNDPLTIVSSGTANSIVSAFDATASRAYFQVGGTTNGLYTQIGTDTSTTFINDFFGNGIAFQLAASEKARIDSSGKLGIGTSAPAQRLHLSHSTSGGATSLLVSNPNGGAGATAGIKLGVSPEDNSVAKFAILHERFYTFGRGDTYFCSNFADDTTEVTDADAVITIKGSTKAVGIGTTAPDSLLHVSNSTGDVRQTLESADGSQAYTNYSAQSSEFAIGYVRVSGTDTSFRFCAAGDLSSNERMRIDGSGRLLVGTSSARTGAIGGNNQIVFEAGSTYLNTILAGNSNTSDGTYLSFIKSRGASAGSHTIVQSGDNLGVLSFEGTDGSVSRAAAYIYAQVDGTPGAADMPGRLVFSTTADGASSPTERLRISQNGVVTIQNGAVAVIDTLTDGATITPDFAAGCNFTVTLGGNRTLANPTNLTAGQSGSIFVVQDATGSRTLAFGSNWDFPGGTAPTLSTAANAVDRIDYVVRSGTSIHTVFTANYS